MSDVEGGDDEPGGSESVDDMISRVNGVNAPFVGDHGGVFDADTEM